MFDTQVVISLAVGALLGFLIPLAALIVYKLRHRKASLLSAVFGAATFIVFALILEPLMHLIMLPLVMNSDIGYVIYGTLAAGIFEESGRFVVCKLLMKKRSDNENAIMLGIGHGGIEAIILMGLVMLSYLVNVLVVNSMGFEEFVNTAGATSPETIDALRAQLESIGKCDVPFVLLSAFERICAMTLHISMSVVVMKSASVPGKLWLYPAAIIMHALFDVPAALYQRGIISEMWVCELFLGLFAAGAVFASVQAAKLGDKKLATT